MARETGTAYIAVLADGRVQDEKERDEKRWGKSSWEMGTERILCASQFTIPNTAATSPDLACNYTAMRSSQLNLSSITPEFSHSLASSTSFSSSSPHPSHSHPLQSSQITKLSHPSLSLHAMIMSWHQVQAYTAYSIHWAQHTPSTTYTEYSMNRLQHTHVCFCSLRSHDYELTPERSFSSRHASFHDRLPSTISPWVLKCNVTMSHSHDSESIICWMESQDPVHHPSTATKYSSNLAQSQPPECISRPTWLRPPSSHDHGFEVHLRTRSITISECISNFTRFGHPSVSPNLLELRLQVYPPAHSITASKCISKYAQLPPPSASLTSLDHGLGVYLQIPSITASQFISNLGRLQPRRVSVS